MKNYFVPFASIIVITLLISGCAKSSALPLKPIYPVPSSAQIEWHKMESYAFIHFGLNTFTDSEWGYGDTPESKFNPTNVDVCQWVEIIKAAGFKGVIFTAKHHDGFCLWPSAYTDYSIKNSPYKGGKGDLVREISDACRKSGLKFGIYLSPWDRNRADYGEVSYVEYYHNQMRELYDTYTDSVHIFEHWFDGANGGDGHYGGARETRLIDPELYYNYKCAMEIVLRKFPSAMIFGGTSPTIRWVGNENGIAPQTNWNEHNGKWLPNECDVSIRPGWFYKQAQDTLIKSVAELEDIYYQSVGRGATLLLNFAVDKTGRINAADSSRIMQWKMAIDSDFDQELAQGAKIKASNERGDDFRAENLLNNSYDSYWATADSVKKGSIELDFGHPITFNRVILQEYIPLGQRVAKFSVQYYNIGFWHDVQTADSTTTIGYKRILRTEPTTTTKVRVNILESRGEIALNRLELYLAP